MTVRQFEKKVSAVLAGYRRYNIISHKTWREDHQLFLSVKLGPEMLRKEPWGVYAVFDRDGKLIRSSCGSLRDVVFTRILMKRIEAACGKAAK